MLPSDIYNKIEKIMAKYLKKFDNHAAYEAFTGTSEFILPNVSLCVNENEVHYNPSTPPTPPTPSHEYVEIGGIKWATMNVGANSITDAGLYFQWGDTQGYTAAQVGEGEGQKYFGWVDYKYNPSGDGETMTKYNYTDGLTELQASDDAVTAAWGGNWRMPTNDEFEALEAATTTAWTADYEGSGISGVVFTSIADSSKKLFFPICGYADYGNVYDVNDFTRYWASSLNPNSGYYEYGYGLFTSSTSIVACDESYRRYGFPVRGILDE